MIRTALLAAAVALPVSASAATLVLDATVIQPNPDVSDFSITFDDADMDGLLSIDEIVSFSGVTFYWSDPDTFYDAINYVPLIAGIADGDGDFWDWGQTSGFLGGSSVAHQWSYEITAAVPLPASALLLLGALGGLAAVRRRKSA